MFDKQHTPHGPNDAECIPVHAARMVGNGNVFLAFAFPRCMVGGPSIPFEIAHNANTIQSYGFGIIFVV